MLARNILTSRAGRVLVGAVGAVALGAGVLVAAGGGATAAGGTNLLANGSFEGAGSGDLAGWAGTTAAAVTLVNGGAAEGSFSAKVEATGAAQFAIYGVQKAAKTIPVGQTFKANAKVKVVGSNSGKPVCLQLLEQTSTTTVQTASQCVTPSTAWVAFPTVTIKTTTAGSGLAYRIRQNTGTPGDAWQVDAVSIVNPDVTAPAAVTGATATVATGPKVTLSWTKATGAYAYKIFRNHKQSPTATVIGATTWTDSGVTQGNFYSYQIQAVDFAGNASALTPDVLAQTPWTTKAVAAARWNMDETTGAVADDALGTNDGQIQGGVTKGQPGVFGTSFGFNGTTGQIIVPNSASLNPGADRVQMRMFVKTTSLPAAGVDFDLYRKGKVPGNEYKMEIQPDGRLSCTFDGSLDHQTIFAGPKLNDGKWHYVVCTKEDNSITLTVDKVSWSKTVTIGSISNDQPLVLGAYPNFDFFKGNLDHTSFRVG